MPWLLGGVVLAGCVLILIVATSRSRAGRATRRGAPPDTHDWDDGMAQRGSRQADAPANLDSGGDDD